MASVWNGWTKSGSSPSSLTLEDNYIIAKVRFGNYSTRGVVDTSIKLSTSKESAVCLSTPYLKTRVL